MVGLPFCGLFPTRVALRLTEADQVDLVLGDGTRDRGAVTEQQTGRRVRDARRAPRTRWRPMATSPNEAIGRSTPAYPSASGRARLNGHRQGLHCRWPVRWLLWGSDAAKVVGYCHEAAASKAGNVRRETRRHTAATDCRWSQHRL
jgi:hypothetical protein